MKWLLRKGQSSSLRSKLAVRKLWSVDTWTAERRRDSNETESRELKFSPHMVFICRGLVLRNRGRTGIDLCMKVPEVHKHKHHMWHVANEAKASWTTWNNQKKPGFCLLCRFCTKFWLFFPIRLCHRWLHLFCYKWFIWFDFTNKRKCTLAFLCDVRFDASHNGMETTCTLIRNTQLPFVNKRNLHNQTWVLLRSVHIFWLHTNDCLNDVQKHPRPIRSFFRCTGLHFIFSSSWVSLMYRAFYFCQSPITLSRRCPSSLRLHLNNRKQWLMLLLLSQQTILSASSLVFRDNITTCCCF